MKEVRFYVYVCGSLVVLVEGYNDTCMANGEFVYWNFASNDGINESS